MRRDDDVVLVVEAVVLPADALPEARRLAELIAVDDARARVLATLDQCHP